MQIVQHLRLEADVRVEHVLRELECHGHRVTIVVVRHVVAPVQQARTWFVWALQLVVEDIDHAITTIGFNNRRDQRDDVVADVLDVRTLIDREAIRQFHQGRWRARFGGVNGARDVINRCGGCSQIVRQRIVHLDRARIGKFRQFFLVGIHFCQQRF